MVGGRGGIVTNFLVARYVVQKRRETMSATRTDEKRIAAAKYCDMEFGYTIKSLVCPIH